MESSAIDGCPGRTAATSEVNVTLGMTSEAAPASFGDVGGDREGHNRVAKESELTPA